MLVAFYQCFLLSAESTSLLKCRNCRNPERKCSRLQQQRDCIIYPFLNPIPSLCSSHKGYSPFYQFCETLALLPFYIFLSLDYSRLFPFSSNNPPPPTCCLLNPVKGPNKIKLILPHLKPGSPLLHAFPLFSS